MSHIIVRPARPEDENAIMDLAQEAIAEIKPWQVFRREKLAREYRGEYANRPTYFVAEQNDTAIGFLRAYTVEYTHTDGWFTAAETTFVRPAKRGTRAAALLMMSFVRWSDSIGASENFAGSSNFQTSQRTAKFQGRFGFDPTGVCMRRQPTGPTP